MPLHSCALAPSSEGRIGARFSSMDCGGRLCGSTAGCIGCHPFVAHLHAGCPAAAELEVGDYAVSIDGSPIVTAQDIVEALRRRETASRKRKANDGVVIEIRRSDLLPDEDAFASYCDLSPLSRSDKAFQSKHRHIGGWCIQGDAALDDEVLPCDGCPECVFGASMAQLTPEQATEPIVLRWAGRPEWLRRGARRPPSAPLRFARGDRVLVPNAHGGLEPGVVRQTRYTEPGWPTGFWVPYQIEREDGAVVYAPEDTDELVRAARSKK